jgi:hypothetical protein
METLQVGLNGSPLSKPNEVVRGALVEPCADLLNMSDFLKRCSSWLPFLSCPLDECVWTSSVYKRKFGPHLSGKSQSRGTASWQANRQCGLNELQDASAHAALLARCSISGRCDSADGHHREANLLCPTASCS